MGASDVARLLVLAGLWGGSFVFIRVAVPALGPLYLAWSRVALAFLALFAMAILQRGVASLRERWGDYLVVGTVNSALPFALYGFAEQYVSASMAAILNATSPFFGALIAALWLKEALTLRQLAGMGLGVTGVVWVVGWHADPASGPVLAAVAACLGAALCYGIGGVYTKVRMSAVPSAAIALWTQLAATLVLTPAVLAGPPPANLSLVVAVNVLALALASTAYAYRLYFRLIADVGPTRALTVTFLIPLFGVLWGVALLGERVTADMALGGALILAGTWVATRGAPRRRSAASEVALRPARPPARAPECAAPDSAAASADRRRCT
ncbi:MAG TPA: DMT family transporter [Casimicrobiaceae bacterium]|jgi:drug/metabolite transporter (DMT)-like permease|nr:DMT family transporter [Casimicrobiaceae bacterium]